MKYAVVVLPKAEKQLEAINKQDISRVVRAIDALANNPRPPSSKKMSGSEEWRLRVGTYRVLYEIIDKILTVTVVKVKHRKDVYKH